MSCLREVDPRVTDMLRAELERRRQARSRSSTVEKQPLVPALGARLQARAARMPGVGEMGCGGKRVPKESTRVHGALPQVSGEAGHQRLEHKLSPTSFS